jgi:hypothetical protein
MAFHWGLGVWILVLDLGKKLISDLYSQNLQRDSTFPPNILEKPAFRQGSGGESTAEDAQ